MRSSDAPPVGGPGAERTLTRLIQLLLQAYRVNFDGVGWKVQSSSRKPATATTRLLETCDPATRTIVLYSNNHKIADGPLEQTLLHALIHTSFLLSSSPKEERIVLALERILWPRLPKTYQHWLRRLVREAKEINGKKVDRR